MSKYTPSTDMVRARYRYPGESSVEDAEFDRWMNQVKADVWDKALEYVLTGTWTPAYNPYRDQEEA